MLQSLIPKDKSEIKPLVLKLSAAVAFSFAGYLLSRAHARRTAGPSLPPRSPRSCHVGAEESQNKATPLEEYVAPPRVPVEDALSPGARDGDDSEYEPSPVGSPAKENEEEEEEEEVKRLRNMVRMLRDRERSLEVQLLEYYGLREQETAMMELRNRLRINNMEAKLFTIKIEALKADNRRLEAQVADFAKVTGELETARAKIKILRKKLRCEAEQNKEQILALEKRVEALQEQDPNADTTTSQRLSELEKEADALRKSNTKLKLENSDLLRRLESTQILATSVLEDQEAQELREVSLILKQRNEELAKEIEQLQADRCTDVEELVYLRWINACLRYELRNFQAEAGKTVARDLSKTLSPKSEAKAKQLILEYANAEGMVREKRIDFDSEWSSSHASEKSTPDDSSDFANRPHQHHKAKFFSKLRRLITGKDRHHHNQHQAFSEKGTPLTDAMQVGSDSDSPHYASSSSTRTDFKASEKSLRFSSPFRSSSLDLQRSISLNTEDANIGRMSSDAGSLHSYRRYSGVRESPSDRSDQDADLPRKSELVKYAEALKGSRSSTPRLL
uniref:Protein CHUP1, chloroplastic n=1 Tax=Kalanchoe fedtschenkoi TaxID=63787 RepID=A0A7N0UZ96_KALFE